MELDEANLNLDRKGLEKLAAANGWTFQKEGGSHTLYRKEGSKEILAIPRHKGIFKTGTARQLVAIATGSRDRTVKEDEAIKPPERPANIKLGKNRSKVKWNPQKVKESVLLRVVKVVLETKADHVGDAYSEKEYNLAYADPWAVLNDENAPSSLKDLAYRVIQVRVSENVDEALEELLSEKYAKEMSPEEHAAHLQSKADAKGWVAAHPINHENIVNSFNSANDAEKEFGKNWYADLHEHAKIISRDTGTNMNQMAGLIANYSPQTHWGDNMVTAAKVARTKKAVGGLMQKTDDEGHSRGVMASTKQKVAAQRILDGEDHTKVLKGRKVGAFAHLIEHGGNADPANKRVCVDRHAFSVACGSRCTEVQYGESGLKGKKRYAEAEAAYVKAADVINSHPDNVAKGYKVEPHELQAITWLRQQRANGDADAAGIGKVGNKGKNSAKIGLAATARHDEYMAKFHPKSTGRHPGTGYSVHESLWGMFADEE